MKAKPNIRLLEDVCDKLVTNRTHFERVDFLPVTSARATSLVKTVTVRGNVEIAIKAALCNVTQYTAIKYFVLNTTSGDRVIYWWPSFSDDDGGGHNSNKEN